ncbi:MAG TPA: phosphoglucomutase/phosphomannomutase family protein [Terriglobales bacterium]|nr:phosphoglucomutase/phosphomannomutase family protein [Terriglobales bacterium]
MRTDIHFGTDGWRGLIADDFTFSNVRRVAQAIAAYVLKHEDAGRGVAVGYDTRFASPRAADLVAETLAAAGIPVLLSNDYVPTPVVSFTVHHHQLAAGVVVTSSHNPWNWNGLKVKARYGGSASPEIMKKIEEELRSGAAPRGTPAAITKADFKPDYVQAITRLVDMKRIAGAGFRFVIDVMYGSGRGVLAGIFRQHGIEHVEIRNDVNPLFPDINPEPIEPHVRLAQEAVVRERAHAGFISDGDADRIGAVDENGAFVDPHRIFCILLHWMLARRQWPGEVARAFNSTHMADRIAARFGRRMHVTPIGFKYLGALMMERDVLIAAEESGGIGIKRHLPERDSTLNALLLAGVMAEEGKTLGQLVAQLQQEFGAHYYGRRDLHIPDEVKWAAIRRAEGDATTAVGRYHILRRESVDGVKLFLDAPRDGSGAEPWLLVRASGTEPLLRLYAEAASPDLMRDILGQAEEFVAAQTTTTARNG